MNSDIGPLPKAIQFRSMMVRFAYATGPWCQCRIPSSTAGRRSTIAFLPGKSLMTSIMGVIEW
jgi:hypothetical protein